MPAILFENGRCDDSTTLTQLCYARACALIYMVRVAHSGKIGGMIYMEVISLHIGIISRGNGRSAIQMAAYCAREKLYSDYTGRSYDYTNRQDLVYHEIMLPDYAPNTFHNPEVLWNSVEKIEKSKNAQLARTVIIALPRELSHSVHIQMVRQYAQEFFVQQGMCVDISIHDKGDGNPHAHLLLTTRSLDRDGKWMCKQRRNYLLDKSGNRIRDPITKGYKLGRSIKTNDWDAPERAEEWRKGWAEICRSWFERGGISKEITHISYARQGIDREPTIHLGAKVRSLEDRGLLTDRGQKNRDIEMRNHERDRFIFREHIEKDRDRGLERNR